MKRSFYISLQTSCNEMLFCGIFISILNHINDSLSWRIRWGKKKNPNNLLLPVLLPGGSASEAAEHPPQPWWVRVPPMEQGIRGTPPLTGPSRSAATVPWQTMGKDHLKQLQTAANKLQTNLLREIPMWCCWLYHPHLQVCK